MKRLLLLSCLAVLAAFSQSPFEAAKDHYKLELDNDWLQIALVIYGPHETSPIHDHPAMPAVYIYTTDGGPIAFSHDKTGKITRPAVKAGQIRYARPNAERHQAEYLGDKPAEYLRLELKTVALDMPSKDVRLPAQLHAGPESLLKTDYENGQIRILRIYCPAGKSCPATEHRQDPAVLVSLSDRRFTWITPGASEAQLSPGDYIRVELKTPPLPR